MSETWTYDRESEEIRDETGCIGRHQPATGPLAASAPELLAALKSAHAALGHVHPILGMEAACYEHCSIAAAIAKAEGRS